MLTLSSAVAAAPGRSSWTRSTQSRRTPAGTARRRSRVRSRPRPRSASVPDALDDVGTRPSLKQKKWARGPLRLPTATAPKQSDYSTAYPATTTAGRRDRSPRRRRRSPPRTNSPARMRRRIAVGQVHHRVDVRRLPAQPALQHQLVLAATDRPPAPGPARRRAAAAGFRTSRFCSRITRPLPRRFTAGRHVVVEAERRRALLVRVGEDADVVEPGVVRRTPTARRRRRRSRPGSRR